jgi:hypothetical protein
VKRIDCQTLSHALLTRRSTARSADVPRGQRAGDRTGPLDNPRIDIRRAGLTGVVSLDGRIP